MANSCIITGQKTSKGNLVSHSNRRVKRTFKPNLQTKRLLNPATGRMVTVTISAGGLRTLRKWISAGQKPDLAQMKKLAA